jgi:hypothetical protein
MANWCEMDRAGAPKAQPSGAIKTKSCHRGNVPELQELRILLRVLPEIVTKSTEDAWWAPAAACAVGAIRQPLRVSPLTEPHLRDGICNPA